MSVWLLVDGTFCAHRARHSTGALSFQGQSTGVSFGMLRDLELWMDLHGASRTILAFDGGGPGLRSEVYPNYKGSRRTCEYTEEEKLDNQRFYEELDRLKFKLLPEAGFRNVICIKGYEADDIIASIAEDLPLGVEGVIISSDGDLLQCLSNKVMLYNPITKKMKTTKSFKEEWGILPSSWASVKALAGCSTDDVEGIRGVGEVTAAKYVAGKLKKDSAACKKIEAGLEIMARNLPLVRLPYPGLVLPEIVDDAVTSASLMKTRADLGIRGRRSTKLQEPQSSGFDL